MSHVRRTYYLSTKSIETLEDLTIRLSKESGLHLSLSQVLELTIKIAAHRPLSEFLK